MEKRSLRLETALLCWKAREIRSSKVGWEDFLSNKARRGSETKSRKGREEGGNDQLLEPLLRGWESTMDWVPWSCWRPQQELFGGTARMEAGPVGSRGMGEDIEQVQATFLESFPIKGSGKRGHCPGWGRYNQEGFFFLFLINHWMLLRMVKKKKKKTDVRETEEIFSGWQLPSWGQKGWEPMPQWWEASLREKQEQGSTYQQRGKYQSGC